MEADGHEEEVKVGEVLDKFPAISNSFGSRLTSGKIRAKFVTDLPPILPPYLRGSCPRRLPG